MADDELDAESLGTAPSRHRMGGRRVVVVGAGQTAFDLDDQPIGNGRAIAVLLGREGASVLVADRDGASAQETVEMIEAEGGTATPWIVDVGVPESIDAMVDGARTQLGGFDGLVYNVGISGPVGFEETVPEAWDAVIDVNLRGAMLTARAALPVMDAHSSIVFISSIGAVRGMGRMIAYDASKAGMAALVRATAIARKDDAVRANIVMPGLIDTGLGRDAQRDLPERQAVPVPLGRRGTAWEVAFATLFLLSRESAYITGQTLVVDGGKTTL
jgi:NAD(P)-dependent dehydrogenase (short-subunit alcohol dehydrogenase family)